MRRHLLAVQPPPYPGALLLVILAITNDSKGLATMRELDLYPAVLTFCLVDYVVFLHLAPELLPLAAYDVAIHLIPLSSC